jgi:hypothetical protein
MQREKTNPAWEGNKEGRWEGFPEEAQKPKNGVPLRTTPKSGRGGHKLKDRHRAAGAVVQWHSTRPGVCEILGSITSTTKNAKRPI